MLYKLVQRLDGGTIVDRTIEQCEIQGGSELGPCRRPGTSTILIQKGTETVSTPLNLRRNLNRNLATALIVVAGCTAWVLAGDAPSVMTPAPPSPKLASLQWIVGTWRADVQGDQLDEVWSAPSGDSMFGGFRWMKGGKAWMFEMLTLMVEGDDVLLRIKHFDNKGVGWEEKNDAVTMKLIRQDPESLNFERLRSDQPAKLNYRKEGPDGLLVQLDVTTAGKTQTQEFHFRRVTQAVLP